MKPWYRQFWPWFLIALPACAVIGSFVTLVLALDGADTLVREDWYQRGQHINEEIALDVAAAARGVSAQLTVGPDGEVALDVEMTNVGAFPATLLVELHHPVDAARDLRGELRGNGSGHFQGTLGASVGAAAWDVSLLAKDWRLQSRVSLPAGRARLQAGS